MTDPSPLGFDLPMNPRMVDIARRAGVTRMAVSAVLMGTGNGRIRVSAETAAKIRRIADEVGYRPNRAAQHLAGKRSGVIAVVAHSWFNYLTQSILARLHEAAETRGFRVLAVRSDESLEPVEHLVRDLQAGWIDGIVYLAYEYEDQWEAFSRLAEGQPRIVVAVGDLGIPGVQAVASDVTAGARASVEHLYSRGRRHPVVIAEEIDSAAMQARLKTYTQVTSELEGMSPPAIIVDTKDWMVGDPAFYPRFDALARRVVDEFGGDCVLCDTDFTAVGLSRAFRRQSLRVPADVALVGWGNLQFSGVFDPTLTTVGHDLPELLSQVVSRLAHGDKPAVPSDVWGVATRLIVREST